MLSQWTLTIEILTGSTIMKNYCHYLRYTWFTPPGTLKGMMALNKFKDVSMTLRIGAELFHAVFCHATNNQISTVIDLVKLIWTQFQYCESKDTTPGHEHISMYYIMPLCLTYFSQNIHANCWFCFQNFMAFIFMHINRIHRLIWKDTV